jgi:hypothetical protein
MRLLQRPVVDMAAEPLMLAETVAVVVAAVLGLALQMVVLETHQVLHQVKDRTVELVEVVVKAEAAEALMQQVEQVQHPQVLVELVDHLQ